MGFEQVARRSVPDAVVDQLLSGIVSGELPAGRPLPSERRLAEELGVSRPTVREALQRLAHTGLIEVRQGDGTMVLDYRRNGGLELLPRLLARGGLDLGVVRSVVQARRVIGREVAAIAAEHADLILVAALREATDALAAETDVAGQQRRALGYWEQVVDGSRSIVFRLLFNGLRAAYEPAIDALAAVMAPEVGRLAAYRALTDAIAGGSPAQARSAADALLELATIEFETFIDNLEASS